VQLVADRHTLDGLYAAALGLRAQYEARAHQPAVDNDAACAAVTGAAAFLGSSEPQVVPKHVEQRLLRLAQELDIIAIDRG
jgi:hypothetical protein